MNSALIEMNIRAITVRNEAERFGLMLKELLEKAEIRFGDGFFNAVLVELLKKNNFAQMSKVAKKFKESIAIAPTEKGIRIQTATG